MKYSIEKVTTLIGARRYGNAEERLRALLTVINNLACFFQTIDVVGTEGEKGSLAFSIPSDDGMENTRGIVHHAKGVDGDGIAFFLKATTYL